MPPALSGHPRDARGARRCAYQRASIDRPWPHTLLGQRPHGWPVSASGRLPLLTGGAADLPERQQTLRNTLAWNHDPLGPSEQALFRRLAVFVGGWTVDAAEAVGAGADSATEEVLEGL